MARIAPAASHNHDLPNVFATLAKARVALDGYLALSEALSRGRLSARRTPYGPFVPEAGLSRFRRKEAKS